MNEERIKELLSNEEYVKGLVDLGSYEAASAKLAEDGVEVSAEDLKKLVLLFNKKSAGELSDEELEEIAGGSFIIFAITMISIGVVAPVIGSILAKERC